MTRSPYVAPAAAVAATAVVGSLATDVTSSWYRRLDKPAWQPPGPVFGVAWTALYVLIAYAGGRARARTVDRPEARRRWSRAFAANLGLNTAWSWLFFRAHRPDLALVEVVVLEASTLDLVRRARRLDPTAGAALLPYAVWVAFATALTAEIARRNR